MTAAGAADSLAIRCAGAAVSLSVTSVATIATTAVTAPMASSSRRRASARLRAARSAAIRSRARGLPWVRWVRLLVTGLVLTFAWRVIY